MYLYLDVSYFRKSLKDHFMRCEKSYKQNNIDFENTKQIFCKCTKGYYHVEIYILTYFYSL